LQKEGKIGKSELIKLINDMNKIFSNADLFEILKRNSFNNCFFLENESNLLLLQDPVTVVGDIHG